MQTRFLILAAALTVISGCKEEAEETTEECFSDDDCPEGETCVISHDHEGDDHDHGGACEEPE